MKKKNEVSFSQLEKVRMMKKITIQIVSGWSGSEMCIT